MRGRIQPESVAGMRRNTHACMFLFRFSIPLTFGSFLCAKDVWGWHWSLALIFALPGLVLAVPGVIAGAMGKVKQ
jgi:hypothetical protein